MAEGLRKKNASRAFEAALGAAAAGSHTTTSTRRPRKVHPCPRLKRKDTVALFSILHMLSQTCE